jgi:outer membrane immunogenic protein
MIMKRALSAAIAVAGMLSPALAADLPQAAPVYRAPIVAPAVIYSWTGCYIGVNAGGHAGRDRVTSSTSPAAFGAPGAAALDAQSAVTLDTAGFAGGGQVGCNYQASAFVFGAEIDGQWLTGRDSRRLTLGTPFLATDSMTNEIRNSWLATARGRLGVTFDRILLYVTGGAAFGGLRTSDSLGLTAGGTVFVSTADTRSTRAGWTVGGGVELLVERNWTVKAEYLYVDLGSFDAAVPCGLPVCLASTLTTVTHRFTDHVGRVGINYLFGPGPVAVTARY